MRLDFLRQEAQVHDQGMIEIEAIKGVILTSRTEPEHGLSINTRNAAQCYIQGQSRGIKSIKTRRPYPHPCLPPQQQRLLECPNPLHLAPCLPE